MVEAGARIPHAKERVVVDIVVAGVDPAELTDDVVLFAGVHVVRTDQTKSLAEPANGLLVLRGAEHGVANSFDAGRTRGDAHDLARPVQRLDAGVDSLTHDLDRLHRLDAVHDLDGISVGLLQANALAAAGL